MVSAEVAITLCEEFGLTSVSRAHPDAEFRYLAGIAEPDRGLGLVEVRATSLDEILEAIATTAAISERNRTPAFAVANQSIREIRRSASSERVTR